jgi:hypothetical protein
MNLDSQTGRLWIADVGHEAYEEIDIGAAGANYGWPDQEGPECSVPDCSQFTQPAFYYSHLDPNWTFPRPGQASIIGGPVYRGTMFPEEYAGNVFFGDYVNQWLRRARVDDEGNVVDVQVFAPPPLANTVVDIEVGPDGALYMVTIGYFWSTVLFPGQVHRISYSASANKPPLVLATAEPTAGAEPLTVQFSSAGTYDPDIGPEPLTFEWEFGDGATSTEPEPKHTYAKRGTYSARVAVSDGLDTTESTPIAITAGIPPTAVIVKPAEGMIYHAGQQIELEGLALDEHGQPAAGVSFKWEVVLIHVEHAHPMLLLPNAGPLATFTVPDSGHPPEETHYLVQLTVVDADGLSGSATRAIQPAKQIVRLDSSPSGIPVFLDGVPIETPREYQSVLGFVHELEAQEEFVVDDTLYRFESWSDGGERVRTFIVTEAAVALTAIYVPVDRETKAELSEATPVSPTPLCPLFGLGVIATCARRLMRVRAMRM